MSGASTQNIEVLRNLSATRMVHPIGLEFFQVVAMLKITPHYLLLTESTYDPTEPQLGGRWRFVLEPMNCDDDRIEVSERETDIVGERLQLLSVVRGVEALEQPSKLTLITSSANVGKRIRKGFQSWIDKGWRWESFGALTPVKDADLWKRIHAAMEIHSIECRLWQFSNRHQTNVHEAADSNSWNRFDSHHPSLRRPYGPIGFEERDPQDQQLVTAGKHFETVSDEPRFVETKTGWTRVTEVDPDSAHSIEFPQAFGETAY